MTQRIAWVIGALLVGITSGAAAQPAKGSKKPAAASRAAETSLRAAYKREFAFLQAEKATLTKRLQELKGEAATKTHSAQGEVDRLQGSIMGASVESERLNQILYDAERAAAGISDGQDAIDRTLEQANALLEKHGIKLPEKKAAAPPAGPAESSEKPGEEAATATTPAGQSMDVDLGQLSFALDRSIALLPKANQIRVEEAEYFDAAGKEVEGPVLRIGSIGAYGLVDGAQGALAPAGAERLKVWPEDGGLATAAAFAADGSPKTIGFFLYESLEQGVERRAAKTPLQVIESGGVIAWVIVGLGCIALLMIALRALMLMRSAANTERLVQTIEPLLERGEREQAIAICRKSQSAAGRVLRATLQHLDSDREHLEDIASEAILHETPNLDRFGSSILVAAAVAPLLGLLGTVTGMISTFDVITEFGTGNPKLLSGGISEALVTTELGLIVAIPALLLGNMLGSWAETIKEDMDKAALRVTNVAHGVRVSRHLSTRPPPPQPAQEPARA